MKYKRVSQRLEEERLKRQIDSTCWRRRDRGEREKLRETERGREREREGEKLREAERGREREEVEGDRERERRCKQSV